MTSRPPRDGWFAGVAVAHRFVEYAGVGWVSLCGGAVVACLRDPAGSAQCRRCEQVTVEPIAPEER